MPPPPTWVTDAAAKAPGIDGSKFKYAQDTPDGSQHWYDNKGDSAYLRPDNSVDLYDKSGNKLAHNDAPPPEDPNDHGTTPDPPSVTGPKGLNIKA